MPMHIKTVTLAYDESIGGFPHDTLERAQASGNLIEAREYFFLYGGVPHITFVLVMKDEQSIASPHLPRHDNEDPSKDLPDRLKPLYITLRRWRNERAKADGVPSYVIFRNMQLAEICRRLPRTKADLLQIEGIGESTWRKYGEEVLALIPKGINNGYDYDKKGCDTKKDANGHDMDTKGKEENK